MNGTPASALPLRNEDITPGWLSEVLSANYPGTSVTENAHRDGNCRDCDKGATAAGLQRCTSIGFPRPCGLERFSIILDHIRRS